VRQQVQKNEPWIVRMPSHNADIAAMFEEIANLLEIEAANTFRIRAYRNAARTIGDLSTEAYAMAEKDEDLTRLPGIGHDLSAKINEIISTGRCAYWTVCAPSFHRR
jgi:DNA polymerase (family 10)